MKSSPRSARAACDGVLQRTDAVEHVEEHLADEDDGEEREHRDGEDRLGVHDLLQLEFQCTVGKLSTIQLRITAYQVQPISLRT